MAKHDDQTFVSFKFVKKRLDDFKDWITSFMTNAETASSALKTVEKLKAVDTDGMVPAVIMEGKIRTNMIALDINADRMHIETYIPGLKESFDCGSLVVDDEHRLIVGMKGRPDFFSIG